MHKKNKIQRIKEDFDMRHFFQEPYNKYLSLTTIYKRKDLPDEINEPLRNGETLDDLCIFVNLNESPPEDVSFPDTYQKIRVFYQIGKIKL